MKRKQALFSIIEKIGLYRSGKASENQEESDQEDNEKNKRKMKTGKVYCKWSDKNTKHTTRRLKHYIAHKDYIIWKNWKDETVSKN